MRRLAASAMSSPSSCGSHPLSTCVSCSVSCSSTCVLRMSPLDKTIQSHIDKYKRTARQVPNQPHTFPEQASFASPPSSAFACICKGRVRRQGKTRDQQEAIPLAVVHRKDLVEKHVVLVGVEGKVDLVREEPPVEVVDGAVWVVHVGMVLKALVHIVVRPCANYGDIVPFYMVAEEEMLIIGIINVLAVYMKIWRVHLHTQSDHNKYN